jgi:F-type H+-transporting ATPase subunit epsilon
LGYGEMRLNRDGKSRRYYVDGGFVQVADNVVSVLTGKAVPAEKLDSAEAAKDLDVAQARAQLRVAGRVG